MNSKEFIQALEDGKTVFLKNSNPIAHTAISKHPNGTFVYMDVPNAIFVTIDTIEAATNDEILGKVDGVPMLTMKTGGWFA